MKLHKATRTGMLMLGVTALASIAPVVADACSKCSGHASHASHRHAKRIYPDEDRWGRRSYFYADPYCGITHSHVSALASHYDHCGHPPIVHMIDIATERVINTYARDDGDWRKVKTR